MNVEYHITGLVMIGSESLPPNTASEGAAVSTVGSLVSSIKLASVTEAQANDKEAIASSAKRDLKDFMMYFVYKLLVKYKSILKPFCYNFNL